MTGNLLTAVRAEHLHRRGRCVALRQRDDSPCEAEALYWMGQVPLCRVHFEPVIRVATDAVERERAGIARERAEREAHDQATDYVYYLQRRDGLIKIGHSRVLDNRIRSLRQAYGPLVLLATHGGGRAAERDQHERFHDDRVEGEWFLPSDELLAHIRHVTERTAA